METSKNQLKNIMMAWGRDLTIDMKRELSKQVKNAGGQEPKIVGSLDYNVQLKDNLVSFRLTASDYWQFIEYGVDGTKKKYGSKFAFKKKNINTKWVAQFLDSKGGIKINTAKFKSLKGKEKKAAVKESKEKQLKAARFLIGRHLAQDGIKPRPFVDRVYTTERINELKGMIAEGMTKDFVLDIKDIFNGRNNKH